MKNKLKHEAKMLAVSTGMVIYLAIVYALSLIGVYMLPGEQVNHNGTQALEIIEKEGKYPKGFLFSAADRIDNFTDKKIVLGAMADTSCINLHSELIGERIHYWQELPVENSALIADRTHYWQGFVIIIRILLMFFDWYAIRYISMIFFFVLLFAVLLSIQRKVNAKCALAFGVAVLSVNIVAIPMCIQFVSVFNITMLTILTLLALVRYWEDDFNFLGVFFCAVGSVVNFFDFLTVPLVTLMLPLGIIIIYLIENKKQISSGKIFCLGIRTTVMWGIGYALTYVLKWLYASIVFKCNMFSEAYKRGSVRFQGEGAEFVLDRIEMLRLNIETFLCLDIIEWNVILILLGFFFAIFLVFAFMRKAKIERKNYLLLILTLYPYVWYLVLANHSQIHYWFTYRLQCIVSFVMTYLILVHLGKVMEKGQKILLK